MEVIAHARTSSNDRRSHRYDTGISSEYVIDFYCPFGPPPLILSLACDTILIVSQEALFCYPHRFHLLHSPQHSWGIRLFIQIDDVIIDTVSHIVTKNGEEIYLKPMEYNCLMVFVKNPNKALTRSQILQELWKEEFCGETRTVDAHVGRIRKKLSWQDKIKTIPRIGYRLEVDL